MTRKGTLDPVQVRQSDVGELVTNGDKGVSCHRSHRVSLIRAVSNASLQVAFRFSLRSGKHLSCHEKTISA